MLISNEFVTLSENDMFQVNGGSVIGGLIIAGIVVCAVVFVVSVCVAAYNSYKDMERKYG